MPFMPTSTPDGNNIERRIASCALPNRRSSPLTFSSENKTTFFPFRRDAHRLMTDHHFSQFPSLSQVGSECGGRVRVEETKDQAEAINNFLVGQVMLSSGEQ